MSSTKHVRATKSAGYYFVLEFVYHCIRCHEEAIQDKGSSLSNYDPTWAEKNVAAARELLEKWMNDEGLGSRKRGATLAGWDRGLQPDTIKAVRAGFAERFASTGRAHELLKAVFKLFFLDREYQTEVDLSFYGGAALCLYIAQAAGVDHMKMLHELMAEHVDQTISCQPAVAAGSMAD